MNSKLIEDCVNALEDDAKYMSMDKRDAFVAMLPMLSKLYRDDATVKGVLVLADEEGQTLVRINATEYEAHGLLHNALPFHDELMRAAQPDHGRMN